MANDPAVLFYTSDFISKTELFTYEQKGQYIHLLCIQHQNGHLPNEYMIKILGNTINPVWKKFQQDNNGYWFEEQMDYEKERRIKYTESRRKNISSRYEHTYESTYEGSMKPHMETETKTDTITVTRGDRIVKERGFKPPSVEEVAEYCLERNNNIDSHKFIDFYEAKGWMIGKNQMKNWKACVRTWEGKQNGYTRTDKPNTTESNETLERRKMLDSLGTEISNID